MFDSPFFHSAGPKKILFKPSVITLPLTDLNPTTQVVIMSNASMPEAFVGPKRGKSNKDDTSDSEAGKSNAKGHQITECG